MRYNVKRKRCIYVLITILSLNFLMSCNTSNKLLNNTVEEIKIGVTVYKEDDKFIASIINNIEKIVKEKENEVGKKITLNIVDAKGSFINQSNQVDKFISLDYDVICVNIVDRTAASTIIDKAKSADIPMIFFNREPVEEDMQRWNKLFYVGAQAEISGEMQAEIVINRYEEDPSSVDKNGDGKIQYVMLEGEHGHQDTTIRTTYCIKTMEQKNIEMEKLADDTANWEFTQANAKMSGWLKNYDEKIEVVFSNNDDMALGAIEAIKASGIKDTPMVVGVDGVEEAINSVKKGELEGTVISDSEAQARAIFDIAYTLAIKGDLSAIDGLQENRYFRTYHKIVTKENVDEFIVNTK